MNADQTRTFAEAWVSAWNAHDLERVLTHYRDDFIMESPLIRAVVGEPSGRLQGMSAVRAYWEKALQRLPDLKFELVDILVGARSVVLYYLRHPGRHASAEFFLFDEHGKVTHASAHYGEKRP